MRTDSSFHDKCEDYIQAIKEDKCCTVIALALVTGQPLDKCFKYLYICGRKKRKGLKSKQLIESLSKSKLYNFYYNKLEKPITINQFVKQHSKGTYYCVVRGHAFAIIDGVVFDHTNKPLRRIKEFWRVYKNEK